MKKLKLLIISLVLSPLLILAQDIPMLFDVNMGICVWGYPDLPSWDCIDMEGPVPGCLLNGVPSQDIVYNFFPNPTVSIEEKNDLNKLDFFIANNLIRHIN